MRKFSKLVAVFVLWTQTYGAHAAVESVDRSKIEQAMLNVGHACQGVIIDQQKYDIAVASGTGPEQAKAQAAVGARFDQKIYDQSVASGASLEDATEMAMTYRYSDGSIFCRHYRHLFKAELRKAIAQ